MGWTEDERMTLHLLNTVWQLSEDDIARIFPAMFPNSEIKPDKKSKGWLVKLRDEYKPRFKTGRSARWKAIDRPWMIPRGDGIVDYDNTPYTNQEVTEFQRVEQEIIRVAGNLSITLTEKDAGNRPATLGGTFTPFTVEDRRQLARDFAERTEPAPHSQSASPTTMRAPRAAAAASNMDPALSSQTRPGTTFSFLPLPTRNLETTQSPNRAKSQLRSSSEDHAPTQKGGDGKRVAGKMFVPSMNSTSRNTVARNDTPEASTESTPTSDTFSKSVGTSKRRAGEGTADDEASRQRKSRNNIIGPSSALDAKLLVPTTIPRSMAKAARVVKHSALTQLRRSIYDEKIVGAIPMVHSRNVVWDSERRRAVFEQHYTDEKYTYSGCFIDQDTETYKQGGPVISLAVGSSSRPVMVCSRGHCGGCFGSRTANVNTARPDHSKSNAPMPVPIFHRKDLKQNAGHELLVFDTRDAIREQLAIPGGTTKEKIVVYEDVVVGFAIRAVYVCAVGGCAVCG